ncbi:MAG TPA: sulfite exporter TauE/SafE family protein, partial [Ruminococcaceae bacterium]|nr:sulfite exporter TauE/SafE family protein [Oscillospiraceae bacterium]
MLTLWKYIVLLLPAGVLAGIASSVAGLASLVSYPALLFAGIPPVAANVTNTAALVLTAVGSGATSKRELHGHLRELLKLLP